MNGISVIICCFNSGSKLIPTLTHLAKQHLLPAVDFEIILVDNNCTDNTVYTALTTWASLGNQYPLHVVEEPIPGLSYARDKGIETARYDYVVFCDDDNWLCSDYLSGVYHLFNARPEVALVGGVGEAVLEAPAPAWFTELNGFGYAVTSEGRQTGYVDAIYGAGMGLRKQAFLAVTKNKFSFILSDRLGNSLASGGDMEICLLMCKAGYKIYYDDSLTFRHFLTANRLQWGYYLQLRRSFGKATAYLQLYTEIKDKSTKKKNRFKDFLSLVKFMITHPGYLLFPSHFKNAHCASFAQQVSMRLTCLFENNKMAVASTRIEEAFSNRGQMQYSDNH
ncbi:MAG: glycosyltransferase [Ferruginibacter sp.]